MGVSSSEEKCEKGNRFKPEESISEQANEFRSECLITEFSENKDQCGNAIAQRESAETTIGVSHSGIDKPSSAEHFGVLSHGVCEHNQETASAKTHEYSSGFIHKETSDKNPGSEILENKREEACTLVCDLPAEHAHPVCDDLSNNAASESLGLLPEDSSKNIQTDKLSCTELGSAEPTVSVGSEKICEEFGEPLEQQQQIDSQSLPNGVNDVIQTSNSTLVDPLGWPQDFASENPSIQQPKLHCEDMSKNSGVVQHETTPKNSGEHRGGRTSKNVKKNYPPRSLRSNNRILLSKSQEKSKATESSNNLVDVGSSKQKKRRKRKREGKKKFPMNIQESGSTLGRLPESLFDSEGEIDGEDVGNHRYFVQNSGRRTSLQTMISYYVMFLQMMRVGYPLDVTAKLIILNWLMNLKEQIFLSLTVGRVFPEAALAAGGQNQDPNFGLPSDDSDENDYDPDISENDEKDQGDESDSEDDDYDPDGPNHDNVAKTESSSSDFTSDSEDLGAMLVEDDISSQKDGGSISNGASRISKSQKRKFGGKKSMNDELLSIMEPAAKEDGAVVSDKRSIQRLEFGLQKETYGNVPSSSSDDDDWNDSSAPRKRKKCDAEVASAQLNGNASLTMSVSASNGLKQKSAEMENTSKRNTRQRLKHKTTSDKKVVTPVSSGKKAGLSTFSNRAGTPGSRSKQAGSSTYKILGESATQGLHKSFKQNQYPDRSAKESLAKELGVIVWRCVVQLTQVLTNCLILRSLVSISLSASSSSSLLSNKISSNYISPYKNGFFENTISLKTPSLSLSSKWNLRSSFRATFPNNIRFSRSQQQSHRFFVVTAAAPGSSSKKRIVPATPTSSPSVLSSKKPTVLVAEKLGEAGLALLRHHANVDCCYKLSPEELRIKVAHCDALIVRSATKVNRAVFESSGGRLKVVGRAGVGIDNVDLAAATEHGCLVVNAPTANTIAAAEHGIALLTAMARNVAQADASMKSGEGLSSIILKYVPTIVCFNQCDIGKWQRSKYVGVSLVGKRLAVLGFGKVGSEVARRAKGLGMHVIAHDPYAPADLARVIGVELVGLKEAITTADFISLHMPLTPATSKMLNAEAFSKMKKGVRIINVARGGVIDEDALWRALNGGIVAQAALDVFSEEPPCKDNKLVQHEKVMLDHKLDPLWEPKPKPKLN
ncbi:D-3-phosphoglycerate dehydrogenase 1 [Hibiscus syriacus]|uniref:D-3-phosphoglycerate dehydrogenase 1 n=1 Tax=Hibiscus syriacus TaxID=106335 RepID=A0A6A3ACG9_HIBSY|nr:D-3-phosphoglycerate dehydrogenase 1 [Hibiscus syriacus]